MADFKADLTALAEAVVNDALQPGVGLDIRIAALKAATPFYLGDSKIRAQLRIKGLDDDDETPSIASFKAIRDRIRKVE